MADVTVLTQAELDRPSTSHDVSRQVVFDEGATMVVQSRVPAGVSTGWHHNGDRHVYGYVVSGQATLEYGPAGASSVPMRAGDFVSVPPGTIRRVVNEAEDPWVIVIAFVGTGPPAVSVDGPAPATG